MTRPKHVEVEFEYGEHGRIDKTLYLSKVRLEIIRRYFSESWRASQGRMFLQLIDEKKARVEVFSSFKPEVKTAGRILTQWLNDPKEIELARKSLKLQGKPLR